MVKKIIMPASLFDNIFNRFKLLGLQFHSVIVVQRITVIVIIIKSVRRNLVSGINEKVRYGSFHEHRRIADYEEDKNKHKIWKKERKMTAIRAPPPPPTTYIPARTHARTHAERERERGRGGGVKLECLAAHSIAHLKSESESEHLIDPT